MSHVFISYKREDLEFAIRLKQHLHERGFATWIDSDIAPGQEWRQNIDDAIREAFVVLVVMTPTASTSEYVTYEWAFALGVGIPVIPILLSSTRLHPRLEAVQYLDFTSDDGIDLRWDRLFEQLARLGDKRIRTRSDSSSANPAMIRSLLESLKDDNGQNRQSAARTLGEIGDPTAIPGLIAALRHRSENTRTAAAAALGQIGNPLAVGALLEALQDRDYLVRQTAVQALGEIGEPSAVAHLGKLLYDHDKFVRAAAYKALAKIGTPEALAEIEHWQAG